MSLPLHHPHHLEPSSLLHVSHLASLPPFRCTLILFLASKISFKLTSDHVSLLLESLPGCPCARMKALTLTHWQHLMVPTLNPVIPEEARLPDTPGLLPLPGSFLPLISCSLSFLASHVLLQAARPDIPCPHFGRSQTPPGVFQRNLWGILS